MVHNHKKSESATVFLFSFVGSEGRGYILQNSNIRVSVFISCALYSVWSFRKCYVKVKEGG